MTSQVDAKKSDPCTASQWQLIWSRFRKHRLALAGTIVLGLMLFVGIFAEFIAPYSTTTRDTEYLLGPPMTIHFVDTNGEFHFPPFVYGVTTQRNERTFRLEMTPNYEVKHQRRLVRPR